MTVFLSIFLLAVGAVFFVPKCVQAVLKWKRTHHPKDFSEVIFYGFVGFLFLLPAYTIFLRAALRFYNLYDLPIYLDMLTIFILAALTFRLFLPKTATFYNKYKKMGKRRDVSNVAVFAFLSFSSLSLIFLILVFGGALQCFVIS